MTGKFIGLKDILEILDLEEPDESRDDEKRRQKLVVALFGSGLKFKKGLEDNSVVMCAADGTSVMIIKREGGLKIEGGSL
ncbi:MAG: hypothetical protein ABIH38_03700 [Patescibacteria group bacterium]